MQLSWGKHIKAGVTERHLEQFQPIGLSLGLTPSLKSIELIRHRQYFADTLHVPVNCLKFQQQVHGASVLEVDKDSRISQSDGMVTNKIGIILNVLVADCCGILLYDELNQAIGALHSGWRGTHLNIAAKGVRTMNNLYGTQPEHLMAFLSPCASGELYVVRQDVAELFPTATKQVSDEHYLFDNRLRITEQLLELGLREDRIAVSTECTISNINYHSFRRDGTLSGRSSVYIGMW